MKALSILSIIAASLIGLFTSGIPLILIAIALIPAKIAENKGHNFWTWYFYGFWLWIFAIIHATLFLEEEVHTSDYIPIDQRTNNNNTTVTYSSSDSTIYENKGWHCYNCNTDNDYNLFNCRRCGAEKESILSISPDNKKELKDYIETQLKTDNPSDLIKYQNLCFGTSSLHYLKVIVPTVEGFDSISKYKENITVILGKVNKELGLVPEEKEEEKVIVSDSKKEETNKENFNLEEELKKYKKLYEDGLIDESEYKAKKSQLLTL